MNDLAALAVGDLVTTTRPHQTIALYVIVARWIHWLSPLSTQGVVVGGSHPFLDPSGYRSHLIFQLMQMHYDQPSL